MSVLLADIGGTHARLAVAGEDGQPEHIETFKADDYSSLSDVIRQYLAALKSKPTNFRMATAAWPDENGVYIFAEDRNWSLDVADISKLGMEVERVENDFVASTRGILCSRSNGLSLLRGKEAAFPEQPCVVVGAGTGLGMAYALPEENGSWHIQQTFGGHMLAAAITEEQQAICQAIGRRESGRPAVFEDMVSGRGLPVLYKAVCEVHGIKHHAKNPEEIVSGAAEQGSKETLRLCHEFLGLFLHTAVLTVHAHGGIYLQGGLISALRSAGLFDWEAAEKYLLIENVPSVKHVIRDIPVYTVDNHSIALYGLIRK